MRNLSTERTQPDQSQRLLVLSQVYPPDPAAVGQYMAEAAEQMVQRGHNVTVLATDRGFDDPTQRFPRRHTQRGVDVIRMPWTHFGKASIFVRLLGSLAFVLQAIGRGLLLPRADAMLISTSPPICGIAGLCLSWLRGIPIVFWSMDINPDQAIAMGKVQPGSWKAKLFDKMNRMVFRRSARVVTLDDYMAESLKRKADLGERLRVLPLWPHTNLEETIPHERNTFRAEHGLQAKRVVMYSGNHSIVHPLDTLLEAAVQFKEDPELFFLFVGGGLGKQAVEQTITQSHICPQSVLAQSLSAADVHLVAMGTEMVGIVHPCKIYSAMACGRPILALAPKGCHVADLVEQYQCGWWIEPGDVDGARAVLQQIKQATREELNAMGQRALQAIQQDLNKTKLLDDFCNEIEAAM